MTFKKHNGTILYCSIFCLFPLAISSYWLQERSPCLAPKGKAASTQDTVNDSVERAWCSALCNIHIFQ